MVRKVGLVYDERMCAHADPWNPDHPETPKRILSVAQRLRSAGVFQRCKHVEAREATDDELKTVHTEDHIKLIRAVSSGKGFGRQSLAGQFNSIYFNEGSSESALLAAGSVIELSLQVARGKLEAGAAIVRPPGHHAEADEPMGFCLFNNVALAAHILVHQKKELGISKVLIVDWDIHHGNATQHMFWKDPQVLYFSVHRYDNGTFYPCGNEGYLDKVGAGDGVGFNVNVPWPHGGFGDADYLAVWDYLLLPIAEDFKPDMVLISAGFDSAEGDPLGGCQVTPYGFSEMTHKMINLAGGRVVLVLEGGYNLRSIAESYLSCVEILLGEPCSYNATLDLGPFVNTWSIISEVQEALQSFWPVLTKKNILVQRKMHGALISVNAVEKMTLDAGDEDSTLSTSSLSTTECHHVSGSTDQESTAGNQDDELENALVGLSLNEEDEILNVDSIRGQVHHTIADTVCDLQVREYLSEKMQEQVPYVWYASYGSNIWEARFLCYLQGGQVDGMIGTCPGARNKNPPIESVWITLGNQLFFGRSRSSHWGEGGVAFITHHLEADVSTHFRIYKIRQDQFNDIFLQENCIPVTETEMISSEICEKLLPHSSVTLKNSWYGTVLCLGKKDGLPILTMTCADTDLKKFEAGLLPKCTPSNAYFQAIARGLMEHPDLNEEACVQYLLSKIEKSS